MDVVLTKHHGLGNDFLVVDLDGNGLDASSCDWADVAQRLCDRRRGIGADGLSDLQDAFLRAGAVQSRCGYTTPTAHEQK